MAGKVPRPVYVVLGVVCLVALRYMSREAGTFSGITSLEIFADKVGAILAQLKVNNWGITFWLQMVLGCVPWTIYLCRASSGTCFRLLWQYGGSILGVGAFYPIQLACAEGCGSWQCLAERPQKPANDSVAAWLAFVTIYGLCIVVTFTEALATNGWVVFFYLFVLWAPTPLFYQMIADKGNEAGKEAAGGTYTVLAGVTGLCCAGTWVWCFATLDGNPFENWMTLFFFVDYLALTTAATLMVFDMTENVGLTVLAFFLPPAAMCLAFAEAEKNAPDEGQEDAELMQS